MSRKMIYLVGIWAIVVFLILLVAIPFGGNRGPASEEGRGLDGYGVIIDDQVLIEIEGDYQLLEDHPYSEEEYLRLGKDLDDMETSTLEVELEREDMAEDLTLFLDELEAERVEPPSP